MGGDNFNDRKLLSLIDNPGAYGDTAPLAVYGDVHQSACGEMALVKSHSGNGQMILVIWTYDDD